MFVPFWVFFIVFGVAISSMAALQNAAFHANGDASSNYSASRSWEDSLDEVENDLGWHTTGSTVDQWWYVDLGAVIPIDSIKAVARPGFPLRLRNCLVEVYESADATGSPVYTNTIALPNNSDETFTLPDRTYGRSVKIHYPGDYLQPINHTEVYVYSDNLAYGKPTTSSGYIQTDSPDNVVDGTRPAPHPDIYHSNSGNAWFQIDLETVYELDVIRLWNRQESNRDRLSDMNMQILADDGTTVLYDYQVENGALINPGNVLGSPLVINIDLRTDMVTGRYVKVTRAANPLQVSEVEVYGSSGLISNLEPSDIGTTGATLNGNLAGTNTSTDVRVYWGTTDQGTNWTQWANEHLLTGTTTGDVSYAVSGLAAGTQYYYRFHGSNAAEVGWAYTAESFWTDPVTNAMALWLDTEALDLYNGDAVPLWPDASAAGNDGSQATESLQPVYSASGFNGGPSVQFDGGDYLDLDSTTNLDTFEIFAVMRTSADGIVLGSQIGDEQIRVRNGGKLSAYVGTGTEATSDAMTASTSDAFIAAYSRSGTSISFQENGESRGTNVTIDGASLDISRVGNNGSLFLNGDVAEVIVFDHTLTETERSQVGLYLAKKHNINSSYTLETRPTSVSGLELWFDADTIHGVSDGQDVPILNDLSGNNRDGTQNGANSGLFYSDVISGKPVVRMDGDSSDYFKFSRISNIRTVFWVGAQDPGSTQQSFLLGDGNSGSDKYHFHRGNVAPSGRYYLWHPVHAPLMVNGDTYLNGTEIDGTVTEMPTNASLLTVRTSGDARANRLVKDRNQTARNWDGDVAELLIFSRLLTDNEQNKIGYYLASKYGLSTSYTAVDNADGATGITQTEATLNGNLTGTSGESTTVKVYWGTSDGGTDAAAWGNTNTFADVTEATSFSTNLTSLSAATVYYYRFYMTNSVDDGWAQETAVFETKFSSVTNGLVLWLDAMALGALSDGQLVSEWVDLSDSGNDAVQTTAGSRPEFVTNVIGGRPVVRFASGKTMNLSSSITSASATESSTVILVHKQNPAALGYTLALGGNLHFTSGGGIWQTIRSGGGNVDIWSGVASTAFSINVMELGWGDYKMWVNGSLSGTDNDANGLDDFNKVGNNFVGDFAEVIIYDRVLTDDERNEIGFYLAQKYSISAGYTDETRPRSIADLELWWDAETLRGASNGQDVPTWYDLSGNDKNGTRNSANSGLFYTNVVGGKPVVRMDGDDADYFTFSEISNIRTVFWVVKEDVAASGAGFLLGSTSTHYHFHRDTSATDYMWDGNAHANIRNGVTELNGVPVNGRTTVMPTTHSVIGLRTTGDVRANSFSNDRGITTRRWHGDLAELLIYSQELTDHEINEIGYYLADKYGLSTTYSAVDNADGATDIAETSATLNGNLTAAHDVPTTVKVFWGPTNGGTDAASWANTNTFADVTEATSFSTNLTGLSTATIYHYRYYMTNAADHGWAQETASFRTQFSSVTNGLELWLDAETLLVDHADGESVTTWEDFSGNGRDVSQSDAARRPVLVSTGIGGKPSVIFDGSNDRLFRNGANISGREIFAVVVTDSNSGFDTVLSRAADSLSLRANNSAYVVGNGNDFPPVGGLRQNNVVTLTKTIGQSVILHANAGAVKTFTNFMVGDQNQHNRYWHGDIAEVIIYDRELTDDERNEVGYYLAEKYGIETTYTSIDNADGATDIEQSSATLNGNLIYTGSRATTVKVFWGTNDGGTNAAAWANTNTFADVTEATSFSTNVSSLTPGYPHFYRFYMTNSAAEVWAQESALFQVPMTITNGLALWLDAGSLATQADGSAVVTWSDLSGNGRHVTQGDSARRPLFDTAGIGGRPSVDFDGSNDRLLRNGANISGREIFAVVVTDSNSGFDTVLSRAADSLSLRANNSAYVVGNGNDFPYSGGLRQNNVVTLTKTIGEEVILHADAGAVKTFTNFMVGDQNQHNRYWDGDIAEIIIFDRALTTGERSTIGTYLAEKYSIDALYPATPLPNEVNDPTLWWDADSLKGLTNSEAVATWSDMSGNDNHGTAASAGSGLYYTNAINGKPVIRFDGANNHYYTFPQLTTIRSVFWVLKEDAAATHPRFLLGDSTGTSIYHFHRSGAANKYLWGGAAHNNVKNGVTSVDGTVVNGMTTPAPTSYGIVSLLTTGNVTANNLTRDRTNINPQRNWDGDVAELIIYDRALTELEEGQVGYYLEQKYGLSGTYAQIDNADGATATTADEATLNGRVYSTPSGEDSTVKVLWGTSDGGATLAWDHVDTVGIATNPAAFAFTASNLTEATTYYYRYYLTNSVDGAVFAESTELFKSSLAVTNGLELWLDAETLLGDHANGASVTTWEDFSGNGRDISQSDAARRPVFDTTGIGGKPAVDFDGTNDRLFRNGANISGREIFAVVVTDSNSGFDTVLSRAADSLSLRANGGAYVVGNGNDFPPAGGLRQNNAVTLTKTIGQNVILHADAGAGKTFTNFMVGDQNQHNRYWDGDIAEIIIYDRELTQDERDTIGLYLSEKYSINAGYTAAQLPDDVDDPALWYDADSIIGISDGEPVPRWYDLSGNGHTATENAANSGIYHTNAFNGKPVIRFDGAASHYYNFARVSGIRTVFWVIEEDSAASNGRFLLGDSSTWHFHRGHNNKKIWYTHNGSKPAYLGVTRLNGTQVNGTTTDLPQDEPTIVSLVTPAAHPAQANRLVKDRTSTVRNWHGDFAELIIYQRELSDFEEAQVGAYLEHKYGLTTDYVPVDNGAGATLVTTNSATLNGRVFRTPPSADTTVKVLWGTSDGGSTLAWDNVDTVGTVTTPTEFAFNAASLSPGTVYYYRYYTTNSVDGGVYAESSEQFSTDLSVTNGLVLWLDSATLGAYTNGQKVSNWTDQSDSGNDAVQSTPGSQPEYVTNVVGGKAVVRVASGKSLYLTSSIPPAGKTVFLVHQQSASQNSWNNSLGGNLHTTRPGQTWGCTRGGGTGVSISTGISSLEFSVNVLQLTVGDYKVWVNGDSAGSHAHSSTLTDFTQVGGNFLGDFAEVIIYDRELSDEERNEIGVHLSGKYGIAGGFTRVTPLPAGVDDPALWYDADSIVGIDDGASVDTWRDISGNDLHATEANPDSGTYYTSVINGKPVVRFDGAGTHYYDFSEITTIRTVFWVGLEHPAATHHQGFLLGHDSAYDFHRNDGVGPGGHRYIWDESNAPLMFNGKTDLNGTEIDGRVTEMPTGASILTVGTSGDASASRLVKDRTGTDRNWKGDVAELLIYTRLLSDYEKGQVGYYLEEKYGLDTEYAKVDNADGATSITATSASLNGLLYDTDDGESTVVKVFWGETDGGAAFGGWDKTGTVATVTVADDTTHTHPVTDLTPKTTYYYRFYASNSVSGSVWVESASVFKSRFTHASNNMMLWLDAEASGLTDGQSVSTWRDVSGNGRHLRQLDSSRQPTFVASGVYGRPSLAFDGTSDRMAAVSINMPAREIIVVTVADAASSWRTLVSDGADGKNIRAFDGTYRDDAAGDFCVGGVFRQNEAYDLNLHIGSRREVRVVASSQQTYGSFMIGDNGVNNRFWDGDIAEVIVYDRALNTSGHAEIYSYLRSKYNLAPGTMFRFR